jgi:nucleoside-diphosphate-sugar epimerase
MRQPSMLPKSDIAEIMNELSELWKDFKDRKILILGGTGFIGTWIVNCLQEADAQYFLNLEIIIVTRSPANALRRNPGLRSKNVKLLELDLIEKPFTNFKLSFDFFIHAATDSTFSYATSKSHPQSSVHGALLILKALNTSSYVRGVHLSSGAVYPKQFSAADGQLETESFASFENLSNYGQAKHKTEIIFRDSFSNHIFEVSNPRLFTFYGPGIPLNKHFAIGNFLMNSLKKEPIVVNGNPDTVRSYMHPIDLVVWIIKLLLKPSIFTLNFGSDVPITMASLANIINEITGNQGIKFNGNSEPVSIYFPSTTKAREHLKVKQTIKFEEGIERWIGWINAQS